MSFGSKKLTVSPLKSLISGDVKLLQQFGPAKLERKSISLAPHVKSFLSSLENPVIDYPLHKEFLERIGLSYIASLTLVSRWLEESGDKYLLEESQKCLYLYLEREPSERNRSIAWAQLAAICRERNQPLDEVHALIESSRYSEVDFSDLSNVVNKVNRMVSTHELVLENHDVKSELLSKMYDVVSKRKSEGDAVDLSRIAWLALHLGKNEDARALVEQGLNIDSGNRYCQKLMLKLE